MISMEYIRETADFKIEKDTVLTLGKFDGIHKGHRKLIDTVLSKAYENNMYSAVFTFNIAPSFAIKDDKHRLLTTNEEKREVFEKKGIDYLIEYPFSRETASMEPEDFIKKVIKDRINAKIVVAGTDFHFGHNREGDVTLLEKLQDKYDYKLIVVEKAKYDKEEISSTLVRRFLQAGDIRMVNELMGEPFFIREKIIHGNEIGRTINIPTINMRPANIKLLPPNGVYASTVNIDGKCYKSVTNIGYKPTVENIKVMGVETYIIDYDGDLYDRILDVCLYDRIREERKFNSLDELAKQMQNDIQKTKLIDI